VIVADIPTDEDLMKADREDKTEDLSDDVDTLKQSPPSANQSMAAVEVIRRFAASKEYDDAISQSLNIIANFVLLHSTMRQSKTTDYYTLDGNSNIVCGGCFSISYSGLLMIL
jgi:hypothetical protein